MIIDDTIAAISTPVGEGGIGIVRMSGSKSKEILNKIFLSSKGRNVLSMKSYTMMYGFIIDKNTGLKLDEVIVSFMKEPNTYTREDIVEINCHGGVTAVRRILSLVLENGARIAEKGEFTKRAFLNGRIDLSEAEAVIDIIRAKTNESMNLALTQTEGKLSKQVQIIKEKLINLLAHIEATIDYPEEGVEEINNKMAINIATDINFDIKKLIVNADAGKIMREGLNVIIIGKPNVGKSSLLNELLEENRAIVTDTPGTTRDIIEEYININGIPVKIVDTAGIRETHDLVESIGVNKAKEYINKADVIMFVVDASEKMDNEDEKIISLIKGKRSIVIANKCDISINDSVKNLNEILKCEIVYTSIKMKTGIDKIKQLISNFVFSGNISLNDVYVSNVRHKQALIDAQINIESGINTINLGMPLDMASIDFKEAYLNIGEITGDTVSEDIINRIFNNFCVGK